MSAPVANFTVNPNHGKSPLSVQFTDTSTGNPTSWAWTFDDGGTAVTTSTLQNPTHVFKAPPGAPFGRFVELTVTNADGSHTKRVERAFPGAVYLEVGPVS